MGLGAWGDDDTTSALVRLETYAVAPASRALFRRERSARALLELFAGARGSH